MKILLIGTGIPTKGMKGIGGAGKVVITIAESFAKSNKVYVVPWWSEKPRMFQKNLLINGVEYIRRNVSLHLIFLMIKFLFLRYHNITLTYTHGLNKIKYSILYIYDRAQIELAIKEFEIEVIHVHGLVLHFLPYLDVAIEKKIPLVCTFHGLNSLDLNINLDFDKNFEEETIRRLSNIDHTTISTVSSRAKELCVNNFHIPSEKIKVILNGVDYQKFGYFKRSKMELREQYSIPQDKVIILQVGTLSKRKNQIAILSAIKEMDDNIKEKISYFIVGEGEEEMVLSNFVKENKLDKYVTFTGWLPNQKLIDIYHLSDFFTLPSTSEGLPLVFLEAIAAGLPIITFEDLEGVKDIFNPECIELIPDRKAEYINDAIERAMKRKWNREKIKEYGRLFSWENISNQYIEIYMDLEKNRC
jgi:glycosyltransferase involved in cell wall biosynthesis